MPTLPVSLSASERGAESSVLQTRNSLGSASETRESWLQEACSSIAGWISLTLEIALCSALRAGVV